MKKNSFLTFIFAFFPGAGQMYHGYMKRGISFMSIFLLIVFIATFLNIETLTIFLPIIFAVSFFDTFHIHNQTYDERQANADKYIINIEKLFGDEYKTFFKIKHRTFGIALIWFGIFLIFNSTVFPIISKLAYSLDLWWLDNIMGNIPTLVVSVLVIFIGTKMLKSTSKKVNTEEKWKEFKPTETDSNKE